MLDILPKPPSGAAFDLPERGGEMAQRIREHDWSRTPLGPSREWPEALRATVALMLASPEPMALWCGDELVNLYNDACRALVGASHPAALGLPARIAWRECWPQLQAGAAAALSRGDRFRAELAFLLDEGDAPCEAHFAVTGSPLEAGRGGVMVAFTDATARVRAERELRLLRSVAAALRRGDAADLAHEAVAAMATDPWDVPFAGVYVVDAEQRYATLLAHAGIEAGHAAMPRTLAVATCGWPIAEALDGAAPCLMNLPEPRFGALPPGPWRRAPRSMALVPVGRAGDGRQALLACALSAVRPFDDGYRRFVELLATQVAAGTARALAAVEVRQGERRYRDLVQGLPAAIYTTDAEGRIELYNEAAVQVWGRLPEPADRYCASHRVFTPEGQPVRLDDCPLAQVLAGRTPEANAELVIERPDGTICHVLANPTPIRDGGGRIVGAVNMLVDISERKRAEAELAATQEELAAQVESLTRLHVLAMRLGGESDLRRALDAVVDTAVETQNAAFGIVWLQDGQAGDLVVHASRGFEGGAEHAFKRVPADAAGGSAGNAFEKRRRWVVQDTETDPLFERYREAARVAGFRAVHSTPIVTRSGAQLGVLSVHFRRPRRPTQRDMQVADVCARHAADAIEALRSQEALRESERLYRAIGESLDYGVWITDAEGRNTYTSESFLKLIGQSQASWGGFGWRGIIHPDDAEGVFAKWAACVRSGALFDQEFRVKRADGAYTTVLGRGVPVRNDAGDIVAWAGINLDIERLKQVENELRELDQRKNEFLATLAHELRNPLAPLRNGLEVLRLSRGDPQTTEQARAMMERQLAQMVRLVDDLLDVSRVSRGKIELRREAVELAAVLRNAMETSQPLMKERRHELVARLPEERVLVNADVTRLSQVFWNLLNNAAKYTVPGGRIELEVRPRGDEVEVAIRDNGVGIPKEMQSRVFDIFTQVDRSLEKTQGGLGIGLSIAKRLVEMHGGTIGVKSEGHGLGSEFTVRLPATVRQEPSRLSSDTGPHVSIGGPKHRVLVADDNEDSAATLSLMLEVMGNDVRVAHDGEEAVRIASGFRPDAILMDIGMPRMNGYDACARIRTEPWASKAFIVALTGWGQDEDKSRSKAAGFDRHLVKPVEPVMIEKLIAALPAR